MDKITTKLIAERCNVSRVTVDRALNGRPGVGEEKRKFIIDVAHQMGYRPDFLAQALVRGESKSLGVVVFDLNNSFFAQLVNEFQKHALKNGYITYVMLTNKNPLSEKECVEHLLSRKVDAIAIDSVVKDDSYADFLNGLNLPILSIMNQISPQIPLLGFDDHKAMYDITSYVISKGYQRLVFVCPPLYRAKTSNMDSLLHRKEGFIKAVQDAVQGVEVLLLEDKNYMKSILKLDLRTGVRTAILCTSDVCAVEIQYHLQKRGLRTPFDYGLTGFDGVHFLQYFEPRLTTVSLNIEELGRKCAEILIDQLQGKKMPDETIMPYTIVPGHSII